MEKFKNSIDGFLELCTRVGLIQVDGQQDLKVDVKSDKSPVTNIDLLSNEMIVDYLSTKFPEDNIISEESIKEFKQQLKFQDLPKAISYLLSQMPDSLDTYNKAELLAWSEQPEAALDILEKLESDNEFKVYKIHIEPAFINLHTNQRFQSLLKKLKLDTFMSNGKRPAN